MSKGATQVRTSETHPLYINEVVVPMAAAQGARHSLKTHGRIGLTFCPGKKGESFTGPDWDRDLQADLDKIAAWGAKRVITLLERFEFDMLGVPDLGISITARGMAWSHLPIPDGQAPEASFDLIWEQKRSEFAGALLNGREVVSSNDSRAVEYDQFPSELIGQAIVQDRFSGAQAQRMMSHIMMVFGLAPAIAPVIRTASSMVRHSGPAAA